MSTGESVTLCSDCVEVGLSLVRGGVEGRLAGLEYSELFNQLLAFSAVPLDRWSLPFHRIQHIVATAIARTPNEVMYVAYQSKRYTMLRRCRPY